MISESSLQTCLIALKLARETEQSVTAQLRINKAIGEIKLELNTQYGKRENNEP